jgi:RNA polymerase sigma factor (sigma-70 family)
VEVEPRANHSSAVNFDEIPDLNAERGGELIALDDALEELAQIDLRKVRVIELRYFGGLTVEESAEALGISPQSVMRDWKLAKAWLKVKLSAKA